MFDATSPSEPAPAGARPSAGIGAPSGIPMDGALGLGFRARAGTTELARLDQRAPCRAFLPYVAGGEPVQAVLVNVAGGLVGGDRIAIDISLDDGTSAQVTTQAAEKVYRSAGRPVALGTRLCVGAGAWLEWMPQPTILFDGANLTRQTCLEVSADARAMAGEILLLGRTAHRETLSRGRLFDAWEVWRDGEAVWRDRTLVEDWGGVIDASAAFDAATATALIVYAAADAPDWVGRAREFAAAEDVISGATAVNGLLLVRWMARDAAKLIAAYGAFWTRLRAAAGGWRAALPTIWQC